MARKRLFGNPIRTCSFCEKSQDISGTTNEAQGDKSQGKVTVIQGPQGPDYSIGICTECVEVCNRLQRDEAISRWEAISSETQCSFCKKSLDTIHFKHANHAAQICDACLASCNEILEEEERGRTKTL